MQRRDRLTSHSLWLRTWLCRGERSIETPMVSDSQVIDCAPGHLESSTTPRDCNLRIGTRKPQHISSSAVLASVLGGPASLSLAGIILVSSLSVKCNTVQPCYGGNDVETVSHSARVYGCDTKGPSVLRTVHIDAHTFVVLLIQR